MEPYVAWRIKLELEHAVICKLCLRKVIDPNKSSINQIFLNGKCPSCGHSRKEAKRGKFKADVA